MNAVTIARFLCCGFGIAIIGAGIPTAFLIQDATGVTAAGTIASLVFLTIMTFVGCLLIEYARKTEGNAQ